MDYNLLYELYTKQQLTDLELILDDGTDKIILNVHKLVLSLHSPFFLKLFTFGSNPLSTNVHVLDAKIARDLILSFYGQKSHNNSSWKYKLSMAKCRDYFGVKHEAIIIPEKIIEDDYDYFLELGTIIGFDEDSIQLLTHCLPENYDLKTLSRELILKMIEAGTHHLVTTQETNCLKLWDIKTNKLVYTLTHNKEIIKSYFSHEKYLVTISLDECNIWLKATGELFYSDMGNVVETYIFFDGVNCIMAYNNNSMEKFNIRTKTSVLCFDEAFKHESTISGLSPTSDEKYLVSTSTDGMIKIWNATNGNHIYDLDGSPNGITDMNFTKKFSIFVTLDTDHKLGAWKMQLNTDMDTIQEVEPMEILGASFRSEMSNVISNEIYIAVRHNEGIKIINAETNSLVKFLDKIDNCKIIFSPDNKFMVVHKKSYMALYSISSDTFLHSFKEIPSSFTFENKYFITMKDRQLEVFNLRTNSYYCHKTEADITCMGYVEEKDMMIYHTRDSELYHTVLYNMDRSTIMNTMNDYIIYKNARKVQTKNALRLLEIIE